MAGATRTLNAEFIGDTKAFAASMARARDATVRVTKAQADLKLQSVQVEKAEQALTATTEKYGAASLQAGEASAKLAVAQARTAVTARNVEKGMAAAATTAGATATAHKRVATEAATAGKKLEYLGSSGQKTARQVKGLALGAAFGFGLAVKATVDFDRSMRNVNSIAGLSEKGFKSLRQRVLDLSGKVAQAPQTLSEGLYDLVSSGFKANDALKILHASAKAATAGLTDTATSTKAVAAVLNAYHLKAKDAATVSDQLFQTVNLGVINFQTLANTIGDVLPFASQLGVGLDQVGAAFSTMTKEGLSGEETATRLKNVLVAFIKPSDGMAKALKSIGVESGEALIKQKGLQGALEAVAKTTNGSKAALATLFPNIRGLGGALSLTGTNARSAEKDLRGFANTGGATNRVFKEQSKSVGVQWQQAVADIKAGAIELGSVLIPPLRKGAHSLAEFVQGMRNGKGAGGRFADAMGQVADGLRPVVGALRRVGHFLSDHPKLIRDAAAAWGAYKIASIVALGAIKIGTIRRVFFRTVPAAGEAGAAAGRAYATAFDAASSKRVQSPGGSGKLKTAFVGLGRIVAPVAAAAIAYQIINDTFNDLTPEQWSKGAKGDLRNQINNIVNGSGAIVSPVADAIKGAPLKLKSPALPTGPVKTPRAPNVALTPTLDQILGGGTTSGGGSGESAKQKAADAAQKRKDAAERARQAAEDARQLKLSMIDALAAFRSAGTSDPLKQNRIQQRADRQKLALATSPLERLQDRTDLRGLKRDAQGLRVQGKQDDIQFALDMGRITNDVAANRLKSLARMVHGNKELKRSLLTQAHSLRGQDASGGDFELNVGDIRLPSAAQAVRASRGLTPTLIGSRAQPTTVHNGNIIIQVNGAGNVDAVADRVVAKISHAQRTTGAAARRARGHDR